MDVKDVVLKAAKFEVKGGNLIITCPIDGATKPSSSGKTNLLCTGTERGLGASGKIACTVSVYTK